VALRNRCTQKLRVSAKLMSIIDDMPAPAVLSEGHDAQNQLNGHSSQNELLQSVWQEWTISATPVSSASQSHHLWIFGTAFGEAVPKTPRFSTHRLCRTQPVVELPRPTRSVISERAAKTAMRTQRLDSRPPGTVIGHRAIPLTPRDFDRQLRTVRYSTRTVKTPYGISRDCAKPCSARFRGSRAV